MRKTTLLIGTVVSLAGFQSEWLEARTPSRQGAASSPDTSLMPRVRSADAKLAALMMRASEQSATFRRLIDRIDATDGIVYVEAGRCGSARACLALTVTVAGPNRILRIVVEPDRPDCEVMASIGHELWHAIEVLREPSIRSDGAMYSFIAKGHGQNPPRWLETKAAGEAGDDVLNELRDRAKTTGKECAQE